MTLSQRLRQIDQREKRMHTEDTPPVWELSPPEITWDELAEIGETCGAAADRLDAIAALRQRFKAMKAAVDQAERDGAELSVSLTEILQDDLRDLLALLPEEGR